MMASVVPLRFENPLLYVDPLAKDDLAGFDPAVAYAKSREVPLRIVSAVDDPAWSLLGRSESAEPVHDEMVTSERGKIESLAARAKEQSVRVESDLLRGPPASKGRNSRKRRFTPSMRGVRMVNKS